MDRKSNARPCGFAALCALLLGAWITPALCATDPSFLLSATEADLADYFPTYLANGYVSTFSSPRGTESAMSHLVAFMDYTADDFSRPAAVPGWTEIDYSTGATVTGQQWLNRVSLSDARFKDYSQVLDLHEATLTTRYRYVDGAKATAIEVTTLVSQAAPHLAASRLVMTPDFDGTVQLSFAFNLWAPHAPRLPLGKLSGAQMEEAVAAHGLALKPVPPATADRAAVWYPGDTYVVHSEGDAASLSLWLDGQAEQGLTMAQAAAVALPAGVAAENVRVYKSAYRLALNFDVKVEKGRTYAFTKYVAFSRQGWGGDAAEDLRLARAARVNGFERLLEEHRLAWERLWHTDILIDGDAKAQQVLHSELYYLLASSTADTGWALGACGLSTGYVEHIFWDSDTWIFPALLLLHPERAKSLVMFRDRTLEPARRRAEAHGYAGAMFPWESDPENGTEQTPHFAAVLGDREIHVTADVAIAQWQYYLATEDRDWLRRSGWPVIRDVARFWVSRATYVPHRHRYEIQHVTSVNEPYNDVPNDTFTNVSAAKALKIATLAAALVGEQADPRWSTLSRELYVPMSADGKHHIDFDPSVVVADKEWAGSSALPLLLYPSLDAPMSEELRRNDYAYAVKPSPTPHVGNSMGFAPTSIAAAATSNLDAATAWFQANFTTGTLKPPFNVRTETAANNTSYFLTASGGYVQNLVFGFSGLRIQEQGLVQAYPPILPSAWKSLTLQNLSFRGERLTIRIARDAGGKVQLARAVGASAASQAARPFGYEVREGLNINDFVRDGKVAAHLLLRSGANPRIIVAFPAGNSGVGLWFSPLQNDAEWEITQRPQPLVLSDAQGRPLYGISTEAQIAAPALGVQKAVLSSVRVLRDYQGLGTVPSLVDSRPVVQGHTLTWARDRLDGAAGYRLSVEVIDGSVEDNQPNPRIRAGEDGKIRLKVIGASGEVPLTPLYGESLLNEHAATDDAARNALTYLSYQEKFLAGSWRFDTYFGRDTLMSVRLLMPVLNPQAVEAGLGSVLERLSSRGEVAHEESIGEFAVLDHLRTDGSKSDAPLLDYKMIDGSYMLAPVARAWLVDDARGRQRAEDFLAADSHAAARRGDALVANLRLVLTSAMPFANDPRWSRLIGIKPGLMVGNWRDSNEGLGRGRFPYDVNAVLVPAALAAAARFLESGLLDPYLSAADRTLFARAAAMAKIWNTQAPPLFDVAVAHATATAAITRYAASLGVPAQPALASLEAGAVRFHALSLDVNGAPVPIMNSDEGFALLFGEPDAEHLRRDAASLLKPFPAGLMTEVGMLVADPVYAATDVQERFSRNAYHGVVVWSWQQALFAAGLQRQLSRSDLAPAVRANLLKAQQLLWQAIDASRSMNNSELWSWSFGDGHYRIAAFGAAGADADESNAAQLWSTVYLAVRPPSMKTNSEDNAVAKLTSIPSRISVAPDRMAVAAAPRSWNVMR